MEPQQKERQFQLIMQRSRKESASSSRPLDRMFLHRRELRIAASFIGIILVSTLIYWLVRQPDRIMYQTGFGETRSITLPDGSEVELNNNTSLSYDSDWSDESNRMVSLSGEAYFSVVHTPEHRKFTVNTTDGVGVEVLGTEFNVQNRHQTTEVVLNTGKVKVSIRSLQQPQAVFMQPGELLTYSEETQEVRKRVIDPDSYTSWKKQLLVFEDESLEHIARTLEDNYGYAIQFSDQYIREYRFTATLPTDKVPTLFTMLAKAFDLTIDQDGKEIRVRPNE